MIDGTLYNGQTDGNFVGRSYNGTTFGAPFSVNTSDLIVNDAAWHTDVRNITRHVLHERAALLHGRRPERACTTATSRPRAG